MILSIWRAAFAEDDNFDAPEGIDLMTVSTPTAVRTAERLGCIYGRYGLYVSDCVMGHA